MYRNCQPECTNAAGSANYTLQIKQTIIFSIASIIAIAIFWAVIYSLDLLLIYSIRDAQLLFTVLCLAMCALVCVTNTVVLAVYFNLERRRENDEDQEWCRMAT